MMKANVIKLIALNEFANLIRSPVTLVILLAIGVMMAVNYTGGIVQYNVYISSGDSVGSAFLGVLGNYTGTIILLFIFAALCLGLLSLSKERSTSSLKVLLVKPVYRRDVFLGKFLGVSGCLTLIIAFATILEYALLISAIDLSTSLYDMTLRVLAFVIILTLYCIFNLSIIMMIGTLFKNLSYALIISIFYVYVENCAFFQATFFLDRSLAVLLDPNMMYNQIVIGTAPLVEASALFDSWVSSAMPYLIVMLFETILILIFTISVFNKEDV